MGGLRAKDDMALVKLLQMAGLGWACIVVLGCDAVPSYVVVFGCDVTTFGSIVVPSCDILPHRPQLHSCSFAPASDGWNPVYVPEPEGFHA